MGNAESRVYHSKYLWIWTYYCLQKGTMQICFSKLHFQSSRFIRTHSWDFPGGTVVKNPPANAGDMGLIPGPGRSHMPWSIKARAPQLLSLHSRAHKPQLLSPRATTTEAHVP